MDTVNETAQSVGEILGQAGMTVLTGMVVVFLVLILLTVIFKLFGTVMSRTSGDTGASRKEKPSVDIRIPRVSPVAPPVGAAASVPAVDDGIDDETVAAICAAIACMTPEGKQYRVRSIRAPRAGGRSAWSMAGLAEATRPF